MKSHPWSFSLPEAVVDISDEGRAVFGVAPGECVRLADLSSFSTLPGQPHLVRVMSAIGAGQPFEMHSTIRRRDGSLRVITCCGEPVSDETGRVTSYEGLLIDDAAQTEALAAHTVERAQLEQSLSALRAVVDGTEHAIIATDETGLITLFNHGAERLLGWSAAEMVGSQTPAVFHDVNEVVAHAKALSERLGETVEPGFDAFVALARREQSETREWTYVRKDGQRLTVSLTVTALRNPVGTLVGYLGVAIDVTAQRQAEAARREHLERLEKISRHLPGVVYQYQLFPDGRSAFPWSSEAMRSIYGHEPESLRFDASQVYTRLHPEDLERVKQGIAASAQHLTPWHDEYRVRVGERLRWVQGNATPERAPDGSVLWHGYISDVTERKEFEEALVVAREQAIEASRVKSEFLANMSHEIRTPLNGILGITQLLLDGQLERQQRHLLGAIRTSGETLLTLINDILDLSKVESGKLQLETVPFAPSELIERVVQVVGVRAKEKGLALTVELERSVPARVLGDPTRAQQVVTNLVSNAVKFTEAGSVRIVVRRAEPRGLCVEVHDTGIGIAAEKLDALFEAFSQVDGSITRRYGGTGLGLTISKRLAEQMGGRLSVVSREGVGSCFTVTLPLPPAEVAVPKLTELESPRPARPLRVLVAEDNAINALVVRALLERDGHQVTIVASGLEAVQASERPGWDLVLMDMQMPEFDGLEATRRIRERERVSGTRLPIYALTANAMKGDLERCTDAGMDDYLTKPVNLAVLRQRLAMVAGEAPGQLRLAI
ncbi:MAG: PAS domain S-box protein [Archangiaceae bacterium]|nr:PAS domain S-box protein [Archangiaceae bacterium]